MSGFSANLPVRQNLTPCSARSQAADANGTAIESDDPADWGVTWAQVSAKEDELVAAEPMRLLRVERDKRLADTDWWAMSDRTMTDGPNNLPSSTS